jgi:excinuclease ABC subunit A
MMCKSNTFFEYLCRLKLKIMSKEGNIIIKAARVNNLKNIDVEIPRGKFVVITGLSGSGKSSLAFDTLYAEGQRRYVESLSSYARQFLGRMSKPEVDYIKGLPPAIAIEQKVNTRNPRSTVGTSTEIYDYLKLLFARAGKTVSPVSGQIVKKHTPQDVVDAALKLPEGTNILLLAKIDFSDKNNFVEKLKNLVTQGFSRLEIDGEIVKISDYITRHCGLDPQSSEKRGDSDFRQNDKKKEGIAGQARNDTDNEVFLVIDRLSVENTQEFRSRMFDSIETAFAEGSGTCILQSLPSPTGEGSGVRWFSNRFEADGISFAQPTEHLFAFNSPLGACPKCEGFGKVIGIDEDLVVPNKSLSIYEDAVACWRGDTMSEWKKNLIYVADKFNFPIHKPYYELTDSQRETLWKGNKYFEGINAFFKMLEDNQYKIQYRVMLARYRGKTLCPDCNGTRLKPEANYVKVDGKSISELVVMPVNRLKTWFENLQLDLNDAAIAKRLLTEINNRLQFLLDVGLAYLTLNRLSNTLSGGESQRINLVTSLGSSLVGSLYILDEPSIGLHPRDTHLLIKVLKQLRDLGNTVVVVEHDEEIMRAADYLIDIGPEAGRKGGEVVWAGNVAEL